MSKTVSSKRVLKIALSTWENASRDKRELGVVEELGAEVLVLAKGNSTGVIEQVDGFNVYRMSTRPLGNHVPNMINRIASIFTWSWKTRKLAPKVISGHDIMALLIGYLSTIFLSKKRRPKLVYDSHEFELGRNTKRSKLQTLVITYLERFLIKRCEFTIVVNDSIAGEVQKIHKLKKRPVVVRNIPEFWEIDIKVCENIRYELLKKLKKDIKFLLIYHGMLGEGRGIETLLEVIGSTKDTGLIILGNCSDKRYKENLIGRVQKLHIGDRIVFLNAVPIKELWKYVGAADLSMVSIVPVVKSYYFALPNKLFESIQSLTPIIASDLPEIKKIVQSYKIGLLNKPDDVKDIISCVNTMKEDKTQYKLFKKNLEIAKKELCWEKEKKILFETYKAII